MVKPRSTRRLPAAERQRQVLRAALPVFAQHGFDGAGTRELAAAAGVSEPILYRHFSDKVGLFCAVLALAAERLAPLPGKAVAGTTDVEARLRALAEHLQALLETHRDELLVLAAAASVAADARIAQATGAALVTIGDALAAALPARGLRKGVRRATAGYLLLQLGLGAAQLHPVPVPVVDDDRYPAEVVEVLLHGLARP
jgi:AcrR family transcriptional regulator